MKLLSGILLVVLFLSCSIALADEASHRAAAEELVALMKTDEVVDHLFGQMTQILEQQFVRMGMPDSDRPVLMKYEHTLLMILEGDVNWKKMKNDFVEAYTRRYTEDELRAISASYKSSEGQEFMEKMPMLMLEGTIISQKKMPELMNKTQQVNMEMIDELRQRQLEKNENNNNKKQVKEL